MIRGLLLFGIAWPAIIAAFLGVGSLATGEPFDWSDLIEYSVLAWAIGIVSIFTKRRDRDSAKPRVTWPALWLLLFALMLTVNGWHLIEGVATGRLRTSLDAYILWRERPVGFAVIAAGYLAVLAFAAVMVLMCVVQLRAAWAPRGIHVMDGRIRG